MIALSGWRECFVVFGNPDDYGFFQLQEAFNTLANDKQQLEEQIRLANDKKDTVTHWEGQIAEIISW